MSLYGMGLAVLAIISGALIAFQAPINTLAGDKLGHTLGGALLSFFVGTVALAVVTLFAARDQIDWPAVTSLKPLLYTGGLLGAFYVAVSIWLTPKIGIGAVVSLGVAGQVLAGLTIDHFGLLGLAAREVTSGRVIGALLVLVGAVMVRYL